MRINMAKHLAFILILWFLPFQIWAEGTKELRPTAFDQGSLLLMPSYTMFGIYGASPKQQIKIRITSSSEIIYFGFNNKNGLDQFGVNNDNGVFVPNIPFRIVSPSGVVVYSSVIPALGAPGHIPTWGQAVAGPAQLGNPGGYNALSINPSETGDYILEFNPAAMGIVRLNLHLFDVTVALNNTPVLGRLHSQGWQISTGSYTNPFKGKVYPYDGSSAVYEVDFNGMQPWVFVINFNSTGTANTGNFLSDRQSKVGNYSFGEYEVFLNPPDEILYPTEPKTLALTGNVLKNDCISADFCLDFTTNSAGELEGFIDLNNNGEYDALLGEFHFKDYFTEGGTKCIPWNGRDAFGNPVTGNFQVIAALGFGITHLPLYDVEHNQSGYKVNIVRPSGSTPPVIFWDDTNITGGSALDTKLNLTGCVSALGGCHRWINRGSILDPTALDKQETINTWWYSTLVTTTFLINIPKTHNVQLSFDPVALVNKDTTVCRGDSLNFYVYNDGDHYNVGNYIYEWSFNSIPLTPDQRQQRQQINNPSEIIVKAIDRSANGCVSYDTLHVHVVDPVTLAATTIVPTCSTSTGSIQVQMLSGPPNRRFYWQEFPGLNSGTLNNLPAGSYHLIAMDPAYPHCGADTSFQFSLVDAIAIDTVITTSVYCYESSATAQVTMVDLTKIYEYSWDGAAFNSGSSIDNLSPGLHSVVVRDVVTGCTDQRNFAINAMPSYYSATTTNELCKNGLGSIALTLPSQINDYVISWNGVPGNQITRNNLSAGFYMIHVQSAAYAACTFDTTIVIQNIDKQLTIQSLSVTDMDCKNSKGAALVTMAPGNYLYSWNGGSYVSNNQISDLSVGTHSVRIQEAGTTCVKDTSLIIQPAIFNATSTNEFCKSGTGSIALTLPTVVNDFAITWNGDTGNQTSRSNLAEGTYIIHAQSASYPSCVYDTTIVIQNINKNLMIQSLSVIDMDCKKSLGTAEISMSPGSYLYSWNGGSFIASNQMSNLASGTHSVRIQEVGTTCVKDTSFVIQPTSFQVESTNELCDNGQGTINLTLPSSINDFSVSWNGVSGNVFNRTNLSSGVYIIHAQSTSFASCVFDTTIVIQNTTKNFFIQSIGITNMDCKNSLVDAEIMMGAGSYLYSWDGGSFTNSNQISNLTAGLHTVRVQEVGTTCIEDTSFIIQPTSFSATSSNEFCNGGDGSISLSMPSSINDFAISWNGIADNQTIKSNLTAGSYSIHAQSVSYPSCILDTTIVILNVSDNLIIQGIAVTDMDCKKSLATVEITMGSGVYLYSWDNGGFTSSNQISNLPSGSHTVAIQKSGTSCIADTSFMIRPTTFNVASTNELCKNGSGSISLTLPPSISDFIISWNGVSGNLVSKTNLSAGAYSIHVQSSSYVSCSYDTTIVVQNIDKQIIIQSIASVNMDCSNSVASAHITMAPGAYLYSWDGGPFISNNFMSNLSAGTHTVRISEANTTCVKDTIFNITQSTFDATVLSENELCSSSNGSITIVPNDPGNTEVVWQDGYPSTFIREGLNDGTYAFVIMNKNNVACKIEKVVVIKDSVYNLHADFNYTVINPNSNGSRVIGFTNMSEGYHWSSWNFGDGSTSSDQHPNHQFDIDMDYTVSLYVIDSNGCWGQVVKQFNPYKVTFTTPCGEIALPNAFSPNDDGTNDDIGILGEAPFVELKIFNRWGEVIFRTFDTSLRWDGMYRGERAPAGVYPYILDWSCPDDDGKLQRFHIVGDISLIR